MESIYVGRHPDKLSLVDQAIRGGTDFALRDEFVERCPRNAALARGVGFGQAGHGP
jgi:hypothetical protein